MEYLKLPGAQLLLLSTLLVLVSIPSALRRREGEEKVRDSRLLWAISLRSSLWTGIWTYGIVIYQLGEQPSYLSLLMLPLTSLFMGFLLVTIPCGIALWVFRPQKDFSRLGVLVGSAFFSMMLVNVMFLTDPHVGLPFMTAEEYRELYHLEGASLGEE